MEILWGDLTTNLLVVLTQRQRAVFSPLNADVYWRFTTIVFIRELDPIHEAWTMVIAYMLEPIWFLGKLGTDRRTDDFATSCTS